MVLATVIGVWLICGALAYGQCLADFELCFPQFAYRNRWRNVSTAALGLIGGPLSLFVGVYLLAEEENRWKFHFLPMSKEASWQAHQTKWPWGSYRMFLTGEFEVADYDKLYDGE